MTITASMSDGTSRYRMARQRAARRIGAALACALLVGACSAAGTSAAPVDEVTRGAAPVASASPSRPPLPPATAQPDGPTQQTTAPPPTATLSGLDGATPLAVAGSGGDGLVAVGSADDGAAAWTSPDGLAWQPADVVDTATPSLRAVAIADDGAALAFGGDDLESSTVWTRSDDGWMPDGDGGAVSDGEGGAGSVDGRVNAMTYADGVWFAVGERIDPEGGGAAGGVVWRSQDGRTWSEATTGLDVADGTVSDVAVDGDVLVVVGFDIDGGRVWTGGIDGQVTAADSATFAQAEVQGVANVDGQFVALGRGLGDLAPTVWRSPDGTTWQRSDVDGASFPPNVALHDLARVDGRLVAVGASASGGVVWSSDDGTNWTAAG